MGVEKSQIEQTNKAERRERRLFKIMDKRHRTAVAGIKIEAVLSDISDGLSYDKKVKALEQSDELLSHLNKDKNTEEGRRYEALKRAFSDYSDNLFVATMQEKDLMAELPEEEYLRTPQELGRHIFKLRVGLDPDGHVIAERRGAYFIIMVEDEDDYKDLRAGKLHKKPKLDASSGMYSRKLALDGDRTINAMVIKGDAFRGVVGSSIEVHERQHFINNTMFRAFHDIEPNYSSAVGLKTLDNSLRNRSSKFVTDSLRGIKDEVLAYLRDGSNAVGSTNFIKDYPSLYGYLYNGLTGAECKDIDQLLKVIERDLERLLDIFSTSKQRVMIVNHLMDVPLSRFPAYLKVMQDYYKNKLKPLEGTMLEFMRSDDRDSLDSPKRSAVLYLEGEISIYYSIAKSILLEDTKMDFYDSDPNVKELDFFIDKILEYRKQYEKLVAGTEFHLDK